MHYTHLTSEERYTIWTLAKLDLSLRDIALALGRHVSTVSRELKRNVGVGGYGPHRAQALATKRRRVGRRPTVLTAEAQSVIVPLLSKRWSPEQVAGRLRLEGTLQISHQSIYTFIARDKRQGGQLHRLLRRKRQYRRAETASFRQRYEASKTRIDERPVEVEERATIGDWEIDTVVSGKSRQVLVTLVERKSRYAIIARQPTKDAFPLARRVIRLLRKHPDKVRSITADNGTEFASFKYIEEHLGINFYFAHPYHSWERGTNENTNGLIRQYFPKSSDFLSATPTRLAKVMNDLNRRPRKVLNYQTPEEAFNGSVALVV
jgi:IS30 family transposase